MRTRLLALTLLPSLAAAARDSTEPRLVPAFGELAFDKPVAMAFAPARPPQDSFAAFVAEQGGKLWSVSPDRKRKALALDLSGRTAARGEMGLLGLALHPRFAKNGLAYVYYSELKGTAWMTGRHVSVIASFRLAGDRALRRGSAASEGLGAADPPRFDPASERVVLRVRQPYRNHNGGCIQFGPDGFLYIALGDGGGAGDPHGNGQRLDTLLGKLLRIDVDRAGQGRAYGIPDDNPFARDSSARPEIYALGLRNPWRFAFDRATGELWAGDVGQNKMEEVDLVRRGGNYGWNLFEGTLPYEGEPRPGVRYEPPVHEYRQEEGGRSVVGGTVYRGGEVPVLAGAYLFADFYSGKVWSLRRKEGARPEVKLLFSTGLQLASFAEDPAGGLYLLAYDGKILRLWAD